MLIMQTPLVMNRHSMKSCYTYIDCCVPIRKLCVLNALSTSDIPNTHLPAKNNFILLCHFHSIGWNNFAPSFSFSAVLKCSLIVHGAFCYRLLGKKMLWSLAGDDIQYLFLFVLVITPCYLTANLTLRPTLVYNKL